MGQPESSYDDELVCFFEPDHDWIAKYTDDLLFSLLMKALKRLRYSYEQGFGFACSLSRRFS